MLMIANLRSETKRAIDAAINRWLEALARVPIGSVSSQLDQYAQLGCRVQTTCRQRGVRLVGLRAAEAPMARCTQRELQALAMRYSGPAVAESGWVGECWRESVRRELRPYCEIAVILGCSGGAVRGLIERGRRKVGEALGVVRERK